MSIFHDNALIGAAGQAAGGGYQVSRSLRFNSADSAYLSRTPASAGNRKTWTWSGWVKRTKFGEEHLLLYVRPDASNSFNIMFLSSDKFYVEGKIGGSNTLSRMTTQVFRDPAAWYHFVVSLDAANSACSIYVNGSQITAFDTTAGPQNTDYQVNSTNTHNIGGYSGGVYLNGYLANVEFVDGSALTPSSFGETDATTGQWIPKLYSGSYGTNGFKLTFADNSAATAAALGKDTSGNSNNWTPNNLSVTAGAGNDSLTDTPTSYGSDSGAGGEVRGNYATFNPINTLTTVTLANGNLDYSSTTASNTAIATIGMNSGKWYWEVVTTAGTTETQVGVYGTSASTLYSLAANTTVYGIRFDAGAGTLDRTSDGTNWTSIATGLTSGPYFPYFNNNGTTAKTVSVNFGQRAWSYTAPSGFKALCDTNLTAPVIAKPSTVMDVKLYTGNGSTQTISGLGFSPDFVWLKSRSSGSYSHNIYDAVRGATKIIYSDSTSAENTDASGLTAFNSDGFSLGSTAATNASSTTYVGWCWDESISAGFDIVSYTGNGANRTISHSLGVAPTFIMIKDRDSGSNPGAVYHTSIGNTKYLKLFETSNGNAAETTDSTVWNNTSPTSSVFSVGTSTRTNANNDKYIAYLWAPVADLSSFGSYIGNGSADGPFVYTGHRSRWLMVKRTDTSGYPWVIVDALRDGYNVTYKWLEPNSSSAEQSTQPVADVDFLSNGFKMRGVGNTTNQSAGTYIYAAFAESPFQYSRAR